LLALMIVDLVMMMIIYSLVYSIRTIVFEKIGTSYIPRKVPYKNGHVIHHLWIFY
jgi:hypothetical protein